MIKYIEETWIWIVLSLAVVIVGIVIFCSPSSRDQVRKYFPAVFLVSAVMSALIVLGVFPVLPNLIAGSINIINDDLLICSNVLPKAMSVLAVFFVSTFTWVLFGWLVARLTVNDSTEYNFNSICKSHKLEREIWFSIILLALQMASAAALSNLYIFRCDKGTQDLIKVTAGTKDVNWSLMLFEHAIPVLSANAFIIASIILGFLWAKRNYYAHAHAAILWEHRAAMMPFIKLPPPAGAVDRELLARLMSVSPVTTYEEGEAVITHESFEGFGREVAAHAAGAKIGGSH